MDKIKEYYTPKIVDSPFTFTEKLSEEQELFVYDIFDIGQQIKDQKTLKDILCNVFKLSNNTWIDIKEKQAPLETEILFKTGSGAVYAGMRFCVPQIKRPIYRDFKKNKIRQNVIKWQLMPQ